MARYIDADMLLKELDLRETDTTIQLKQGDEKHRLCQKGILSGLNWSRNIIYETPTADVMKVVRCKECKHWNNGYCEGIPFCGDDASYIETKETDFCSYGERKDA